MNLFMFADGYLQENEQEFIYSIPKELFENTHDMDILKEKQTPFGLRLKEIDHDDENFVFHYEKKPENMSLLKAFKETTKKKIWEQKKDWIAYSLIQAVREEHRLGFFVLPIPENFLVGDSQVSFVYKALESMPITGFDFSQLFVNLKRLVIYLYGKDTFEDLLKQKETKTTDSFMVSLSKATDFEELLNLIPYTPPQRPAINKKTTVPIDKKSHKERKLSALEIADMRSRYQKEEQEIEERTKQAAVIPHKQAPEQFLTEDTTEPVQYFKPAATPQKRSRSMYVVLSCLVLSIIVTGFFAFDKITYPSQVRLLKKENSELLEKIERKEERVTELEEINDSLTKETKELSEENEDYIKEIEENVKTIKELISKNDELKKEISK